MKKIKIAMFLISSLLVMTTADLSSQVLPVPYGITVPADASDIQWYADTDGEGFQWLRGEHTDTLFVDSPGIYFAEYESENCTITSDYFIFIHRTDPFIFPITLNAAAGADAYQWYDGEEEIGGEVSNSLDVHEFGEYYVLVDDDLCRAESSRLLVVNPQSPYAADDAFTVEPGRTISESVMSNDGPASDALSVSLLTDVPEGELELQSDGSFTYTIEQSSSKTVSFDYELRNVLGLSDTATVVLNVGCSGFDLKEMYVPQLLSPNGDGKNDNWVIDDLRRYKHCYSTSELLVFNLAKQRVYQAIDYGLDGNWWTGKSDNDLLPSGTYYFLIIIDNDEVNTLNGFIHLE